MPFNGGGLVPGGSAAGSGAVDTIESTDGTISVTNPGGPVTNISARPALSAVGYGPAASGDTSGATDTAAINAYVAAHPLASLVPDDTYWVTSLTPGGFGASGVKFIVPAGCAVNQVNGTSTPIITNLQPGTDSHVEVVVDGEVTGFYNQTDNAGGVVLIGAQWSKCSGVGSISYTNGGGFWVKGYGVVTAGASNHNTAEDVTVQNIVSGACFRASPATTGDHPDDFACLRTKASSNSGTWYQIDAPSGSYLGCDAPFFSGIIGEADTASVTAIDLTCQDGIIDVDRFENTGGTLTLTMEAGTGSFPGSKSMFRAGSISTVGGATWNDNAFTLYIGPGITNVPTASINVGELGVNVASIAVNDIGVWLDATILSCHNTFAITQSREAFTQLLLNEPMASAPVIASGSSARGVGLDNNSDLMLLAKAVNTWIDNGTTVAKSNVLDDGSGNAVFLGTLGVGGGIGTGVTIAGQRIQKSNTVSGPFQLQDASANGIQFLSAAGAVTFIVNNTGNAKLAAGLAIWGASVPASQPSRIGAITYGGTGTSTGKALPSITAASIDTSAASLVTVQNLAASLQAVLAAFDLVLSAAGGGVGITA